MPLDLRSGRASAFDVGTSVTSQLTTSTRFSLYRLPCPSPTHFSISSKPAWLIWPINPSPPTFCVQAPPSTTTKSSLPHDLKILFDPNADFDALSEDVLDSLGSCINDSIDGGRIAHHSAHPDFRTLITYYTVVYLYRCIKSEVWLMYLMFGAKSLITFTFAHARDNGLEPEYRHFITWWLPQLGPRHEVDPAELLEILGTSEH